MNNASAVPVQGPTIAALSTARGNAAIGVLRLSGVETIAVADRLFRPLSGRPLSDYPARAAVVGHYMAGNEPLDKGVAVRFAAPNSFTGEDTVEFSLHGGQVLLDLALKEALRQGARPAQPGEFSQRAFLNGKMDLAESEAIIDLITATGEHAAKAASRQAEGQLSRALSALRAKLVTMDSDILVYVDYAYDGVDPADPEQLLAASGAAREELRALLSTFRVGGILRDGVPAALFGRPNAGKSSVLNLLLGRDRAIVTDLPGTTRDVLEETVPVGGYALRLSDTAGLREGGDAVERIGVSRARDAVEQSTVKLAVFDQSAPLTPEDRVAAEMARQYALSGAALLVLLNKSDLPAAWEVSALALPEGTPVVALSAKTGEGLSALHKALEGLLSAAYPVPETPVLTSERHYAALCRAEEALLRFEEGLSLGVPPDIAESDLLAAINHIGNVTGESAAEDVVEAIFSRFCVGK